MATEIITRARARALGHKRYFTGECCKAGHRAERLVSNLTCIECVRLKSAREYPNRDKGAERERLRKWRAANREKDNAQKRANNRKLERRAKRAAWYQANKERIRPARIARYAEHRADRIAYSKEWVAANPERARELGRIAMHRRRARKRNADGDHTAADLAEILAAQKHRCAYCRADLRRTNKHVDHIVPLARGGSNGRSNLQYLCQPCNQAKNWKDPNDFARSLGLLI